MRRSYPFRQAVNDLLSKEYRWQNVKDKDGIDLIFLDLHEIAKTTGFLRFDENFMEKTFGVNEKALMLERKEPKEGNKDESRGPSNTYILYPDYQYDSLKIVSVSDIVTPRSHEELEVLVELAHKKDCKIAVHPKDRAKYFTAEVQVLLPVNDRNYRPQIGELERVDKAHEHFVKYQRTVDERIRCSH